MSGKKVVVLFLLLVLPQSLWARGGRIQVEGALKESLNSLLKVADDLHTACVKQNEPKIATSLKSLMVSIKKVQKTSTLANNQKPHLNKILDAIHADIRVIQNNPAIDRRKNLKSAFSQIVQIVKVYDLDNYRVFFCSKDRSVWIQKGWKPKNPIHPEKFKNCGKRVR